MRDTIHNRPDELWAKIEKTGGKRDLNYKDTDYKEQNWKDFIH